MESSENVKYNLAFGKKLRQALSKSSRPILLLGGGVRNVDGKSALADLLDEFRVPIVLSWVAKDILIFKNQNLCGLPGYFCNRAANAGLHYSDLIITIGCRLDPLQMGYQPDEFFKSKKILVVDIDEAELEKHPLNCENKFLISAATALVTFKKCMSDSKADFTNWTRTLRNAFVDSHDEMVNSQLGPFIDPYYLVDTISNLAPDIYVAGSSGGSAEISFLNFKISPDQTFLNSPGLGSMGFAIPSVVGALEGQPDASIICVVGDGGLQMNIQELATITRYRDRKVLIVILNNGGYDSMRRSLNRYFGEADFVDEESGLFFPALEKLAAAYEFEYARLESNYNIQNKLDDIWEKLNGPTLLELKINHDVESFPKLLPKMNEDGSISSGSFIDCAPEKSEWYVDLESKMKEV